ncbi:hypothetical protein EC919_107226 [Pseudomonas graminis]|uniref:hypothetical protein n=1 Tax=Pseudomonas graminis TaxID=158627 RepID=UPI0010E76140|nr:hypothetical protein [Pseudomonas graminis]TDV50207.1 hypothetical protein EC919_107226 [Pseudomonas graminis]
MLNFELKETLDAGLTHLERLRQWRATIVDQHLEAARFASSNFRERILSDITALPLTRLMTHLTNAHEIAIDSYNHRQTAMDGDSYFDSVLDIASSSHAADEIRRLTH